MRLKRPVLTYLLLSLTCTFAESQQPSVQQDSRSAKSARSESNATEPYVFELVQNKIAFEADGKGYRDLVMRARVKSESAVREFGLLIYPFAASFETVQIPYVRVRKPDGSLVETPASDVQELDSAVSREAPMYTDQREKHVAVKSLSVGDTLEVNVHWTIHDPIARGHFWYDHSFFRDGVCLKEILEIDVPHNLPVKLRNPDFQPSVQDDGARRVYTFENVNLKRKEESKIPAWEKGKTTNEDKIRALYDFVSTRFRYIGIDLGLSRYTPHSAAEVLANRYGDCKDKHTLVAALLQAIGFSGTVSDVSVEQPEDTGQALWLAFAYHRSDLPDWKDRRIVFPAPPIFIQELNEEQKVSKDPLPLGSPREVTYEA